MTEYTVIVSTLTGAHYDCATLAQANEVFDTAPVADAGERLLTINGVIARREYLEG
tara:strand:+ start:755 stop:922 length:168 start_codon:yes stop_codon:yes gene_type:complete